MRLPLAALSSLTVLASFLVGSLGCVSDDTSAAPSAGDAGLVVNGPDATTNDASAPDASPRDTGAASDAPSNVDASPGAWASATALPVARIHSFAAAPGNGYVYVIDGYTDADVCNNGTADGRVFYAKQNADGTLGAWTEGTAGPSGFLRSIAGHADANGFLYVAGGANDGPAWDGSIWFSKPGNDGSIAAWALATHAVGTWIGSAPLVAAANGVLYVGGGFNAFASPQTSAHMFMATLDATSGQPGAWAQIADLPEASVNGQLVISAAGYAYAFAGNTDVYVAKVSDLAASAGADAGVDAGLPWTLAANALPTTPSYLSAALVGTSLYVAIGGSPDVYVSALQADGSLGAWSLYSTAPAPITPGYQGVVANGFFYVLGDDDCNASTAQASATYFTPLP